MIAAEKITHIEVYSAIGGLLYSAKPNYFKRYNIAPSELTRMKLHRGTEETQGESFGQPVNPGVNLGQKVPILDLNGKIPNTQRATSRFPFTTNIVPAIKRTKYPISSKNPNIDNCFALNLEADLLVSPNFFVLFINSLCRCWFWKNLLTKPCN